MSSKILETILKSPAVVAACGSEKKTKAIYAAIATQEPKIDTINPREVARAITFVALTGLNPINAVGHLSIFASTKRVKRGENWGKEPCLNIWIGAKGYAALLARQGLSVRTLPCYQGRYERIWNAALQRTELSDYQPSLGAELEGLDGIFVVVAQANGTVRGCAFIEFAELKKRHEQQLERERKAYGAKQTEEKGTWKEFPLAMYSKTAIVMFCKNEAIALGFNDFSDFAEPEIEPVEMAAADQPITDRGADEEFGEPAAAPAEPEPAEENDDLL